MAYLRGLGLGFGPILVYMGAPGPGFEPFGGGGGFKAWIFAIFGMSGAEFDGPIYGRSESGFEIPSLDLRSDRPGSGAWI